MVHVLRMFLSEWREFPSAPCLVEKKKRAQVSMLLKSRASPDMLPFSLCNKKRLVIRHMNGPVLSKTLSIPSYDIGKYFGLGTYQHSLVKFPIPGKSDVLVMLSYRCAVIQVCFHTRCALIQSVLSYRVCSHTGCALVQCAPIQVCSHTECAFIQVCYHTGYTVIQAVLSYRVC